MNQDKSVGAIKTELPYKLHLHVSVFRDGLLEIRRCKHTENAKIGEFCISSTTGEIRKHLPP